MYILTTGYLRRVRLVTHKSPFFMMYPCIPTCTIGSRLVCCVRSGGREKYRHRLRTCTLRVQSPPAYDAIREYHEIPDPWTIYEGICSLLEARMFQAKTHGRRFKIRSSSYVIRWSLYFRTILNFMRTLPFDDWIVDKES